jgi:hypothetical protein
VFIQTQESPGKLAILAIVGIPPGSPGTENQTYFVNQLWARLQMDLQSFGLSEGASLPASHEEIADGITEFSVRLGYENDSPVHLSLMFAVQKCRR